MKKVFLGGTCNGSSWREKLIPFLKKAKIEYFNPVVDDWTPDCQEEEYKQKESCGLHLYIITKEMTGAFSIAEAVDSVWQKDKICIFQVIPEGFSKTQIKSFQAIVDLIIKRGGFASVTSAIEYMPGIYKGL